MKQLFNTLKNLWQKRWIRIAAIFLLAAALSAVGSIRYLRDWLADGKVLFGDDVMFHINRIQSMADAMRGGQFPVFLYPNALNGYGYASSLFYPELFLYLPALLVYAGMPLMVAFFLFCWLIDMAMFGTMYLFAGCYCSAKGQRVAAASLYLVLQYVACDITRRAAMGEALALIFLPLVFLGLYNMVKEGFSKPYLLLFGVVGLTYSHTISLFLAGIVIVLVTLRHFRLFFFDPEWWKKVGSIIGIYLLVTAAYFVPFLIMMLKGKYQVSYANPYPHEFALDFESFFRSVYGIGVFGIGLLFCRLFVRKTEENALRLARIDGLLKLILLLLAGTTVLFPWKLLNPLLSNIQFPWRLNGLASVLLAVYGVLVLRELFRSPKRYAAVVVVLIVCMVCYNYTYLGWGRWEDFSYNEIGAGEWLPTTGAGWNEIGCEEIIADTEIFDAAGNVVPYIRTPDTTTILFFGEGGNTYTLPLFYYYGYEAEVLIDGVSHAIPCAMSDLATLSVTLPAEVSGMVTVAYHAPAIYYAAWGVSVVAAVGSGVGLILWTIQKRKRV